MQNSSSCSNDGPVLPLSNPILLGVVRNYKLSVNAMLSTEVLKLIGGILTPTIRSAHHTKLTIPTTLCGLLFYR